MLSQHWRLWPSAFTTRAIVPVVWAVLCPSCLFIPIQSSSAADALDNVVELLELVIEVTPDSAKECINTIANQVRTGEVKGDRFDKLKMRLTPVLKPLVADAQHALHLEASQLAASFGDADALAVLRTLVLNTKTDFNTRVRCLETLISAQDATLPELLDTAWQQKSRKSEALIEQSLVVLGSSENAAIGELVLRHYPHWNAAAQTRAIELLTQRPAWSKLLLQAMEQKQLSANALNASQIVKLQTAGDAATKAQVKKIWGVIRLERNPQREQVVTDMRKLFREQLGDAERGQQVFQKICGQCHKIHGQGHDVGPDITANGRASFDQLLSNVFDPSLVIGPAYQARVVVTEEGRVLTGLIAEENEQRVVLKLQGGKVETIPREQVEEINISPLSLMPEALEKQLTVAELRDLFAFLVLDKPPSDAAAVKIPGSP